MKKTILAFLAVLAAALLLSACEKAPAEAEGGAAAAEQGGEPSVSESAAPPEGTFAAKWGGFSVYLPEESVLADYGEKIAVKDDALCCGKNEGAAEFAKIVSVDAAENTAEPFARYDEQFANAERAESSDFGNKEYRAYDFQTEVQTEAFGTVYENKTVYCLLMDDEIVVIEFYPLRGIGISTQKAEFEKILYSIGKQNTNPAVID